MTKGSHQNFCVCVRERESERERNKVCSGLKSKANIKQVKLKL